MCGNARRKGREVCPLPTLPKDRVEGFIIDRIKNHILTDENIAELVKLTNQELTRAYGEEKEKLELIHTRMDEMDSSPDKLCDALETGNFKNVELASRIRVL